MWELYAAWSLVAVFFYDFLPAEQPRHVRGRSPDWLVSR